MSNTQCFKSRRGIPYLHSRLAEMHCVFLVHVKVISCTLLYLDIGLAARLLCKILPLFKIMNIIREFGVKLLLQLQ